MDDLSEKLAGILNDPESMEKVRRMAENLFGGDSDKEGFEKSDAKSESFLENMPNINEMQKLMSIISKFKSVPNDNRANLLLSLKPHLSDKRQEKVDNAIKLLKIIQMLPLLKESGLLNLLG